MTFQSAELFVKLVRSLSVLALSALLLAAGTVATAQVATGLYAYGTFDSHGFDSTNVGSLNTHFSIPVFSKAGRGLPFSYALSYDSSIWTISNGAWIPVQGLGWLAQTVALNGYVSYLHTSAACDLPSPQHANYDTYSHFVYHDNFGIGHSYNSTLVYYPSACGDTNTSSFSEAAKDGSGFGLTVTSNVRGVPLSPTVTGRTGNKSLVPSTESESLPSAGATLSDLNGNVISVSSTGVYTDTLGTTVMTVAGSATPSSPVTLTYPIIGGTAAYTIKYTNQTVQTNFACSGVTDYAATVTPMISEIDLPDNSKYLFTYEPTPSYSGNVTGRLASVTLPTGGVIAYTYTGGNNGIVCVDGSTAGLTRKLTNDPAASIWTYTRTPATTTSQTAVTDGLQNHYTYNFIEPAGAGTSYARYLETNRDVYQGATSGTALLARQTCYNGSAAPCTTTSVTLPVAQIDTYETLNGVEEHGSTVKINASGFQTERDDYDFASSGRGPLLRKEVWTYPTSGLVSLLSSDTVYDGTGNEAALTNYAYDQTSVTATSGLPQHSGAIGSQRGNLTTLTQYASSGSSLITTTTYEDTGNPLTVTTPNGASTYAYESTTHAYVTTATPPTPSSGVSLPTNFTYDLNTGLTLTTTDPNSAQTVYKTYDSFLRPLETDNPDGGKTVSTYPSVTQWGQHAYQNASVYADTEVNLDAYGRSNRTAVANGQSGNSWYQQDGCFDANGNTNFVSYPYQGTGFNLTTVCSGAGDTYSYDVLGRVSGISRQNGEGVTYTYTGRATQVTDENNVKRITQIDGLGRPSVVCEVSSSTLEGVAPSSCGTDITATGFKTTYTYNLSTGLTTVSQGTQTRTFQTDWLGRTTLVTEPESGQATYSYAYNSKGLVVTRKRPEANQTTASVVTTTTTQYDALGRVISVTYDDSLTPNKTYDYDTVNAAMQWSQSPSNLKGRMADMASGSGTSLTRSLFSYDMMGRVIDLWQCAPSICGTSSQASRGDMGRTYDWTGNIMTGFDPTAGSIAYTYSPAGEVTSITNQSYTGTGNPPNLVSSVVNGPNGPTSYSLGNGLGNINTYDSLGRFNGTYVCNGGTSQSCGGGTQVYGSIATWKGVQQQSVCDTVLSQCVGYGYDEFNRLNSRTTSTGTSQNYTYTYDRFGNRWQQNLTQGTGPSFSVTFNASNQASTNTYDAAGNSINDGFHTYTYDAEGNVLSVDSGNTGQYVYDALNRRVASQKAGYEYMYDPSGRRVSSWIISSNFGNEGRIYWGSKQIAYRAQPGYTIFEHSDLLGTERMRTSYQGQPGATFPSLPFGDGFSDNATLAGADQDNNYFAGLEKDTESGTEHAQFRQYSDGLGRWMRPDPYSGSYDPTNPQSFNRYTYVLNNPLALVDSWGLNVCNPNDSDYGGSPCINGDDGDDGDGDNTGGDQGSGDDGSPPVNAGNPFVIVVQAIAVTAPDEFTLSFDYGAGYFGLLAPNNCPAGPANVYNFIHTNQAAANSLSQQSGVNSDYLLGISGWESQWGANRFAVQGNNFFSLHGGSSAPFATGSMMASGANVSLSTFPSYFASGQSFLAQYGSGLAGATSPAAFAQQLINNHFNSGNAKTGGNPNFLSNTVTGINMVIRRKGC